MASTDTPKVVKKAKGGVIGEINKRLAEKNPPTELNQAIPPEPKRKNGKDEEPVLVQGELAGMETEKDEDIIRAADAYRKVRDERMKLVKTEVERRDFLQAMMNSKGIKHYKYEGLSVDLVAEEKVKVKVEKDEDEE